jgi:hypothetical protein
MWQPGAADTQAAPAVVHIQPKAWQAEHRQSLHVVWKHAIIIEVASSSGSSVHVETLARQSTPGDHMVHQVRATSVAVGAGTAVFICVVSSTCNLSASLT